MVLGNAVKLGEVILEGKVVTEAIEVVTEAKEVVTEAKEAVMEAKEVVMEVTEVGDIRLDETTTVLGHRLRGLKT